MRSARGFTGFRGIPVVNTRRKPSIFSRFLTNLRKGERVARRDEHGITRRTARTEQAARDRGASSTGHGEPKRARPADRPLADDDHLARRRPPAARPRRRAAGRRVGQRAGGSRPAADAAAARPVGGHGARRSTSATPPPRRRRRPLLDGARRAASSSSTSTTPRPRRSTPPSSSWTSCSTRPASARADVIGVGMGLSGPVDLAGAVGHTVILPDWAGLNAAGELDAAARAAGHGRQRREPRRARRGLDRRRPRAHRRHLRDGLVRDRQRARSSAAGSTAARPASPASSATCSSSSKGAVCRCGNRGCLETVASTDALLELLRPAHGRGADASPACSSSSRPATSPRTASSTTSGARSAACSPASSTCLDPQAIIVGGELSPRRGAAAPRDPRRDRPLRAARRAAQRRGQGRRAGRASRGARRARARDQRHRAPALGRPRPH